MHTGASSCLQSLNQATKQNNNFHVAAPLQAARPCVPARHKVGIRFPTIVNPARANTSCASAHALPTASMATSAAAATTSLPAVIARHAQDPQVIYRALLAPLISALGGEASWQFYLARRFMTEVVAVVLASLAGYWLLTAMAKRGVEANPDLGHTASTPSTSTPSTSTTSTSTASSTASSAHQAHHHHSGLVSGEMMSLAAAALTGPAARGVLAVVLALNVFRSSLSILDGFITVFSPQLPNDWLDDLVRLAVQSLTPLDELLTKMSLVLMVVCGCAVLLRWKDGFVSHVILPQLEGMERGQELASNLISPASNFLNWVVIVAGAGWLASGLGINLQPMLAVGGASGIIIGLATQQVLSNFVSGLNIFLARPFVAGEYISLISQNLTSQTNVSGRVIRVDPMRTLIATDDNNTVTVPNQVIAVSIVVNRSRTPHWSVGRASPLLANPRELRWRMRLPHGTMDKIQDLELQLRDTLDVALPVDKVRHSLPKLVIVNFQESWVEVAAKVNLVWRLGAPSVTETNTYMRRERQEELVQAAMLSLQKTVRGLGGVFLSAA